MDTCRKCKTCKHWQLNNNHKIATLAGLVEGKWTEDLQTEKDIKNKMGFYIRECLHPKVVSDSRQEITKDSVILQYDYGAHPPLFTAQDFGCINHEKKPAHL